MSRVICDLTISADGYAAGLDQTAERPFGDDSSGAQLHARVFETPTRTGPRSTGWPRPPRLLSLGGVARAEEELPERR